MVLIILAFSSDLRVGLTLQLQARPDFQFFELVCVLFLGLLVLSSPSLILRGMIDLAPEDILLICFMLNAALLSVGAEDFFHNISRTKDYFLAFGLYSIFRYGPFPRRSIALLVRLMVAVAFAWSAFGLVQWLGWDEGLGGETYRLFLASQALYKTVVDPFAGEVVRANFAHGIYLYPQNFIYYLIGPFALGLGLARRKRRWLVAVVVIFAAMLGTLSKTFDLLLAIFAGVCILYRFYRNIPVALGTLAGLGGLGGLAILLFGDYAFWKQALGTFTWRLDIWSDVLRMLSERPWLLLTGDGTQLLRATYSRVGYPNPHQMFLYTMIEYGLTGAVLFFSFLFVRFRKVWAKLNAAGTTPPETLMLFWGLLVFTLMGLVDDMFVQTQITALYFFYLGLLTRLADSPEEAAGEPEGTMAASRAMP